MASLYEIAQQERRNAQTGGYSGYPAGRVGQQTAPGTRITRGNAAGLYKPKAAKPYLVSKDKSLIDASQAVTGMALPDGSVQPIQASSGAPFVVQKPGSRSTYLDPETGNELQPDITSPTGLRDVTAQRQEEQAARASERSRVATAKLYEKVQGQMVKEQEEAQKQRNAEKANTFLAQGRKYFVDRVSGEPIPHETDQEFKALQTEKAKKKAEETRSRTLRQELERLDIEADETKLTSPLLSDSEHQKLKDAVEEAKLGWHQAGIDPEAGGLDALRQDPNNLPAIQKYEQDVAALKSQQETRERLAKIERKKLDLRKQALEPVVWQQEKRAIMEAGSDADLDREIEEGKTTLEELEAKAQEEAAPIKARDDELLASYNDAQARYNGASTVQDRVKARQDLDLARNRLIAWETESAGARESVTESYKALNDRATIYNDTVKARQARAVAERESALNEMRQTPFLAPYAQRLEALDAEQATRQEALNQQYPDGIPDEAQQALAQDVQTKRDALQQELGYAYQTKESNLRGLYEKYGAKTRSEDWRNEQDPQLSGLLFNVQQDAKKMGVTEQEARTALERYAALDWSNPRRLLSNGKPDFSEDYRMLPEGAITVNPRHYLDEAEYAKAVEKSPASPEAKKTALAMRRDLAAPLAAQALGELMADPQMGTWMQDNTQGNPLERMEQFNAALKKGGAVEAIWNGFRSGAGSLAGSLLGAGAALTGNELLTDSGKYFQQHAAAYQMASDAAGKGTGALGRFVAKVAQAAPSVAPGIAVGLATAGAGAPVAIGLAANALTAGLQGLGGTYLDAYEAYQDKGFSPTEARAKALTPAIASGLTTSLITLAGGARGAESVLNTVGRDALRSGVRSAIGRVLGNASEEAIEELTDQVTQGVIAQASYAGEKDIEQILRDGIEAGLIGATLGGAMSGAREVRIGGKAPAAPTSELPPESVAPVPDIPLPEQQAGIRAAIEAFVPTPELLPPSVAAVAETKGAGVAAQDAATALTQIAQGTPLEALPAAQLEVIGLERTDKGVVPRKGVQPLVYQQDGQTVIRDEAADWLDSENQPLIRDQITLSEQDRLVQIQESKQKTDEQPAKQSAAADAATQIQPSEPSGQQRDGLQGSEVGADVGGLSVPVEPQAGTAESGLVAEASAIEPGAVEPTPERQQPLIPSRPKPAPAPKAAPPSRRKAIGKGSAGAASYAEFAADADVDAFTYLSDVRASRSNSKSSSQNKRDKAYRASREKLARLSERYGVEPAQMADLLTQYNKAVVQQAKGTQEGKAFQAESFADFMARSQPEPSPAAPAEPGTTESPESAPTSQNPLQDAADALGYTANGKMKRDGWAATQKGADTKKLQATAKSILESVAALQKIQGVKISISSNQDVAEAQYLPDGTILLNPRKIADQLSRDAKSQDQGPRDIVTHELIHHVAASHISPRQYAALWRSLTPETQETALREYYRHAIPEGGEIPQTSDAVAGAEFFTQIIEARLKGTLSSQVWDSPSIAKRVLDMVRQYIDALRNLAGLTKDPEWRDIIQKQADAVEQDLRDALRTAGVEQELLGEVAQTLAAPPSPETPSPIPPDSPKANSPSDLQAQQDMEAALDALAQEELRTDPQAMRALAEAQVQGGTVQRGERALGSTEAGARAIQKASIMARELNGKEVRDFEQVREEAKAAIQKDRQAVEDRLFSQIDEGQNFNDLDTAAAVEITNLLTRETAVNPGDDALYARLVKLTNHWADSGSETARALAIRRDPLQRPIDNLRKAISVVKAPPASVRRKVRVAWTDRQKTTAIQKLEKRIRDIENEATVKLMETEADKQAEIKRVRDDLSQQIKTLEARPSKDEILRDFIQSDKARQAEILKQMGFTQEDIMLDPEDRYGMREAVLDVPAIREKMGEFSKPAQNAVRLAMLGYSDSDIATRTGLKTGDVPAIIERFRQSILKPAIAAEVKAGNTFGNLLTKGLEKLKGVLRMARITQDTLANQVAAGEITAQDAAKIEAEVDRIVNFALQPARHRNRASGMQAKTVTLQNGQRVKMFVPFDPDDARGYYRYARELSTRDASGFDKLYEYWINGILSGPQTQVANIAGNVGQIAWNYTAQRATESLLNLAYRDKSLATFGEAPHVLRAFMQSFVPAWNQAALAWQTEADLTRSQYLNEPLTVAFKDSELDKQGGQRAAIGGKTGRVVRIPGRLLRFFDSAFKTAILHMEATAHAYREARQKGLRGPALTTYMETRLAEKGNDVWQQAMNVADELLFQSDNWATETAANFVKGKGMKERIQKRIADAQAAGKPEEVASLQKSLAVANFVSGFMRFLFPFTKTPTNILRVGIRKAGGSALSGLWNVSNGLYQRAANGTPFLDSYSKAKQVQDLSETFLAGLAWTMLAGLAEGDDDDSKKPILIVGNRPFGAAKVGEKEEVMRRYGGTQVVIFRNPVTGQEIGRFQYGRYEPFATALGVIVDTMREVKQSRNKPNDAKKALELTGSVGAHLIAQAESKSFLQGLASIARSVEEIRSGRFEPGQAAAKFIISGIVPNLIRQTLRNQDDLQRDFKTGGWKHEAWPSGQFAEPMIGPGGEKVRKSGTGATRTLVSVPNAPSKPTPENFFQTYNDRHPENRIDRGPLSKDAFYAYGPDGKKKVELSESADKTAFRKLYEETYAKLAGKFVVQNPLIRTANPPLRVVDDARDVNSKALRETRMRFLAQKSRREAAERVKNKPIQK